MYRGIIIEESLQDLSVLDHVRIAKTTIEEATIEHNTPWLTQWTLDEVEIEERDIEGFIAKLQPAIETEHTAWYADFKNDTHHYIVFPKRIFHIDRSHPEQYAEVVAYGVGLGIPEQQLDFSSQIKD